MMNNFNDREYWVEIDSKQIPIEESMASRLLDDDILFAITTRIVNNDNSKERLAIGLAINLNDVFVWACSDCELISMEELPHIFKLYQEKGYDGIIEWGSIKRNEKPQDPIVENMKKSGTWTEELDKLPDNVYWISLKNKSKE